MKKLKPDQAPPIAAPTFALAFVTAVEQGETAAADRQADGKGPGERARFALRQMFAGDNAAAHAAWLRFNALMALHADGALGNWARDPGDGRTQFHPAVLDAASQQRLSANGRFAPRKFLAATRAIALFHYADFAEWPLPESD